MGVIYPVLGILMIGGFYICLVIGAVGLIDVVSGHAHNYLSHCDWLYKDVGVDKFWDVIKKEKHDAFLHFKNGDIVGLYEYVE